MTLCTTKGTFCIVDGFYFDGIKEVGINKVIFIHHLKSQWQRITSSPYFFLPCLIRKGFLQALATLQQSPQRPTYLPKWPARAQGSPGAATSPVTGNKQKEGKRREGEVERKEGGDIQKATMTRRGPELVCLRTHIQAHVLGLSWRFSVDNNKDMEVSKRRSPLWFYKLRVLQKLQFLLIFYRYKV